MPTELDLDGAQYLDANANVLTIDALDPFGKIPEYKFCAVRVEAARREE